MVTVSGTVLFYNADEGLPTQTRQAPSGTRGGRRDQSSRNVSSDDVDSMPRLFSQSFVLSPETAPDGTRSYIIQSETFRFVG